MGKGIPHGRKPAARRRAGPQTAAGKRASRQNALKHGLTSTTLLPEALRSGRVDELRRQFEQQHCPANATERILVNEMARHAAMMELSERSEGAVLRHGARELSKVILGGVEKASHDDRDEHWQHEDAILSAAVSTEALDKFNRYRRSHEKSFYAALNKLLELQSARAAAANASKRQPRDNVPAMRSEEACRHWLRERFRRPDWKCPRCGHARGSWLEKRRCWECASCHRQTGIRSGTVMQGSRLPLRTWFLAIQVMRADPHTTTGDMAERLDLQRRATVRNLMCRIRDATAAENASELLAGLMDLPLGGAA